MTQGTIENPGRLSLGILLPQEEGPGDPSPSWDLMSSAARVAEDVGLDSVWLVDHFQVQVRLFPNDLISIEQLGRVVEAIRSIEDGRLDAAAAPG